MISLMDSPVWTASPIVDVMQVFALRCISHPSFDPSSGMRSANRAQAVFGEQRSSNCLSPTFNSLSATMQADTEPSDQDSEIDDAVREVLEAAEVRRRRQGGSRFEPNWKHAFVGLGGACVWSSIKALSQPCAPERLASPWSACGAPFESTVNGAAISSGRPVVRWVGLDGSSVSRISMPRSLAAYVSEGGGGGIWMVTIVLGSFFEYEGFHVRLKLNDCLAGILLELRGGRGLLPPRDHLRRSVSLPLRNHSMLIPVLGSSLIAREPECD